MQTILRILKQAGGWHHGLYLKIENPPYMALVIEASDESGPCSLPSISIAHYGEQNGDLMRDPEMCFELGFIDGPHLGAFYYRKRLCRRGAVYPLSAGCGRRGRSFPCAPALIEKGRHAVFS